MRAIDYPCRCLWRGLAEQMTRTTPLRRMTLHFTQIFFTDARTFMGPPEIPTGRATAPEQTASLYRLAPHPDCRPGRLGPTRHQRGCVNSSGWAPCQHGAPEGGERVVEGVAAALAAGSAPAQARAPSRQRGRAPRTMPCTSTARARFSAST